MPPWIHDQFGCNQKKPGGIWQFAIIYTYIYMHTYIYIYIYTHRNLYIYIYNYIYWIWFWQMGQGHESPPSFLLTSTVPGCWGGVCSHTQMGGVVTVIDPNLPRVIWLGNEISCKFLQYLGRLRFSESTCACCHVAYVAIFGLWIVLSGPDAPPSLLWLPFSTKWWHLGLCHRTSAQSWDFLPHSVGFQPGSQSSGLIGAHGPGGQITGVKTFRNQKQMLLKISIK